jgi:hypothetical protein
MPPISLIATSWDDLFIFEIEEFEVIDAANREWGYCLDQYTRTPG